MWDRMRGILRVVFLRNKRHGHGSSFKEFVDYESVAHMQVSVDFAVASHVLDKADGSAVVGKMRTTKDHQEDSGVEFMANERSEISPGSSFESGRETPESCSADDRSDLPRICAADVYPDLIPTLIEDILESTEEGECEKSSGSNRTLNSNNGSCSPGSSSSRGFLNTDRDSSYSKSTEFLNELLGDVMKQTPDLLAPALRVQCSDKLSNSNEYLDELRKSEECLSSDSNFLAPGSFDEDHPHSADERELRRLRVSFESQESSDSLPEPEVSTNSCSEKKEAAKITKQRSKRQKMEELKNMYKHFENKRGSADLYQTMLDAYADFLNDQEPQDFNNNELEGSEFHEHTHRMISVDQCKSAKEELMKMDLVLTELADTEKDYVDYLAFVVDTFIPFLHQCIDVSIELRDDIPKIFGNIEEIHEWHSKIFLENLENCLEEPELLGATFSECEEEMASLYSQYCRCKPAADSALNAHEEELELLRMTYLPNMKLNIKDYLIKPVQRLMKYQLLLSSVKKHMQKAGLPVKHVNAALEVMSYVPKEANNAMHVAMIDGYEDDLSRQELIFQDVLDVAIGKTKARPRPMRVFLFEDVLLLTESVKRNGLLPLYQLVAFGRTSRMGITQVVENDQMKFAIWFRKFRNTDIFVCQSETMQMKESWTRVLLDVINIQSMLQSKSGSRTRPSCYELQRSRSRNPRSKTWSYEESVRKTVASHPRAGAMSEKLKKNIEKYIMNELILGESEAVSEKRNPKIRTRSKSLESNRRLFMDHQFRNVNDRRSRSNSGTPEMQRNLLRRQNSMREPDIKITYETKF